MTFRMIERLLAAALVLSALFFVATRARAEEAPGQYWAAEYARQATMPASKTRRRGERLSRAVAGLLPVVAADLVAEAQRYLGSGNFTRFAGPWCKAGLNIWLRATGHYADLSLRAIDALGDGPRLQGPAIGAIAVMRHHVAVVTGVARGGVWTISANHGHRVGEGFYPRRRIIAFVQPSRGQHGKL